MKSEVKRTARNYFNAEPKKKEHFLLNNKGEYLEINVVSEDQDDNDDNEEEEEEVIPNISCHDSFYVVLQEKEKPLDLKNVLNKTSLAKLHSPAEGYSYFDTLITEQTTNHSSRTISW